VDPLGTGRGPVAGHCKFGDEFSGSGATELVIRPAKLGKRLDSSVLKVGHNGVYIFTLELQI
jgi:hypothetical protein